MTTAIKRRRGTTAEHSTFVGLEGEITIDSTKDTVVVHDGSTAGGFPLAKENNATLTGNVTLSGGTANGVTYLNGSKVLTSGSALTFDGTNLVVANGDVTIGTNGKKLYVNYIANNSGTDLNINGSTNQIFSTAGSEQMRLTSTGLGIGTSSPSEKLHVAGRSRIQNLYLGEIASNYDIIQATSSAGLHLVSSGGSAYLDSSGNLGLGVTPSAWVNAKALEIGSSYGAFSADTATTGGVSVSFNAYAISASSWKYRASTYAMRYTQEGSSHSWYTAPSGTAGNAISFTQAMTLTAGGDLLVGTTNADVGGTTTGIRLAPYGTIYTSIDNTGFYDLTIYADRRGTNNTGNILGMAMGGYLKASIGVAGTNGAGNDGAITFNTIYNNDTKVEQMRLTVNGLGIGTSSPSTKLNVVGGITQLQNTLSASEIIQNWVNFSGVTTTLKTDSDVFPLFGTSTAHPFKFMTSNTERMRIDGSGNLLVGTTSVSSARLNVVHAGTYGVYIGGAAGASTSVIFFSGATNTGSISTTGTSTAFNTSSDYRLKVDWQPMTGASERVKALKPVNFAWKVDGSRVDGFLAHEAQEVVPEAVTGTKDAVDAEGKPEYQGIDQSKLVPLLTAALQEALTKIDSLTARIEALEGN